MVDIISNCSLRINVFLFNLTVACDFSAQYSCARNMTNAYAGLSSIQTRLFAQRADRKLKKVKSI
jgi:hypothetical protein